jgi:hypothetical protein
MPAALDYSFRTVWRFEGSAAEVAHILSDNPTDLARWWPSVYLKVDEVAPGDENGIGQTLRLFTKGWLPYTLVWELKVTDIEPERCLTIEASGDFVGTGEWNFLQQGKEAVITYDWNIRVNKPLLRYFSWCLKPMFSANHRWAMDRGYESLLLEIARRHATTPQEMRAISSPPQPTSLRDYVLPAAGLFAAVGGLLSKLWFRARSA